MQLVSSGNRQRAAIFDDFQAAAVECATTPGFVAELGEHALALQGIVEHAYPLNVRLGAITVPRHEKSQDNVGVIIAHELQGGINRGHYFASLPLTEIARVKEAGANSREAAYISFLASSVFYKSNLGKTDHTIPSGARHTCMHASVPIPGTDEHMLLRSRNLISFGTYILGQTREVRGSTFLHEADHVMFARDTIIHNPYLYSSGDTGALKTMTERRAHHVSFTALRHMGLYDDFPNPEALAAMNPRNASDILNRLSMDEDRALPYASFLAKVLTLTYSGNNQSPSLQEISLYNHYGITL